jgi:nitrogen regulatory protein PII 2
MKEVMAIIRMNMINKTKEALLKEGFSSLYCRKVMGRGKRKIDFSFVEEVFKSDELIASNKLISEFIEVQRLLPKRMITLMVNDEDLETVVKTITNTNITGNPGDGKIFISNVPEIIRIRTGEKNELAI